MAFLGRVYGGFRAWWFTRDRKLFLQGLPAVLAMTGLGALAFGILLTRPREVEARYLGEARTAFKAKDFGKALTCYDRLASLGNEQPHVLYELATTIQALGQPMEAARIMKDLAPSDRQGYGKAHVWFARHLLAGPNPPAAARQLAQTHLLRALDGELEDRAEAHGLLGELYLNTGKLDQAEIHLLQAVRDKPQLRLRLAQLYARRGDKDRARSEAHLAASDFRAWAKGDLYEPQARLGWADAAVVLEDFSTAVDALQEGWKLTQDPLYARALARVYLAWADSLHRGSGADFGAVLGKLEEAMKLDPANRECILRLWAFTRLQTAEAAKARTMLRAQLVAGKAPAIVHLALGMDAWERKQTGEAVFHLEQAYRVAPKMALVANNLAWVLAQSEKPDLPRALALADSTVKQWPREAMFRDTRGHIYAQMGKWKEALTDLQLALKEGYTHKAHVHQKLSEVYDQLNVPDLAAEHRRLAQSKAQGQKGPKSKRP